MKHLILDAVADDVTTTWLAPGVGKYTLVLRGTFASGTVKLQFSDDGANAAPDLADFTWTAAPEPFTFEITDAEMCVRADLSGVVAAGAALTLAISGG